jgi:5'-nucleotidase
MRIPREQKLAREVPEVDIILGGHDHVYHSELINGVLLLKSGTDFEEFSDLKVTINFTEAMYEEEQEKSPEFINFKIVSDDYVYEFYSKEKQMKFECKRVIVNERFKPDPEISEHVKGYCDRLDRDTDIVIGYVEDDLEARFSLIRT